MGRTKTRNEHRGGIYYIRKARWIRGVPASATQGGQAMTYSSNTSDIVHQEKAARPVSCGDFRTQHLSTADWNNPTVPVLRGGLVRVCVWQIGQSSAPVARCASQTPPHRTYHRVCHRTRSPAHPGGHPCTRSAETGTRPSERCLSEPGPSWRSSRGLWCWSSSRRRGSCVC
jgi:hypothetical protein